MVWWNEDDSVVIVMNDTDDRVGCTMNFCLGLLKTFDSTIVRHISVHFSKSRLSIHIFGKRGNSSIDSLAG